MIVQFENVSYAYPTADEKEVPVLSDVSFSISRGEFLAVIGRNGSGKSTLAKLMNAILLPTAGDVLVESMNTKDESHLYDVRQRVGLVFQNPDNQIVATIVEEDVAFALENLGVQPHLIRWRVDEALDIVGMLDHKTSEPHKLSGGQKQRVAIAGVLAMQPDCIVLDESTAMLDPKGRDMVMRSAKRLNEERGITIVLITHYLEEAAMAGKILMLQDGTIAGHGTPKEVFRDVEGVRRMGLEVPEIRELCYLLEKEGIPISQDILTIEDCAAALETLLEPMP